MAKKQNKQSAQQGKRPRQPSNSSTQSRNARQRSGDAANYSQKKKTSAAPQQAAKPKRANKEAVKEASTPGNILWRLSLILCVGLVIFSLLFASINGGSNYVGITYENDKGTTTPTPPISSVDPNVNITGSDATPIPPSPTSGVDEAPDSGDTDTVTP